MNLEETRRFCDDLSQVTSEGTHPPSGDQLFPSFLVTHSLFRSMLRQGYAALLLCDGGFPHESIGLRRSVLEYVTTIEWVARKRQEAVDALNGAHAHRRQKLATAIDKSGEWSEGVLDAAGVVPMGDVIKAKGADQLHMTNRLRSQDLYSLEAMYIADSGFVHPSITEVHHYYEEKDDGSIRLLAAPVDSDDTDATCMVVAVSCFNGAAFLDELLPGNPWQRPLKLLGAAHGFVVQDTPRPY